MLCIIIKLLYLENHTEVGLLNGGSGHVQSLLVKTQRLLTMESIATIVNFRTKFSTSI